MDQPRHRPVEVTPVNPLIGALVDAGDLRTASDAVIAEVKAALYAHQVVFIRGQHLEGDDLLAVAQRFDKPLEALTAVFRPDDTFVQTFEIGPNNPPRADRWHTDISFYETPPSMAFMSNLVAPELGGDTMFSSSYEVYGALSAPMQAWCQTLSGVHAQGDGLRAIAVREAGEDAGRRMDEICRTRHQPLVIRHPHTGRLALFMSSFIQAIAGLTPEESETMLALLRRQYDNPNFQARWRWSAGDLVIWDQRAVNHRGLSDHYPNYPRRKMQTVFVHDGIPAASIAALPGVLATGEPVLPGTPRAFVRGVATGRVAGAPPA